MNIVLSEKAKENLFEIFSYIAKDDAKAAHAVRNKIFDSIDNLAEFPYSGTAPKDKRLADKGYRKLVVYNFIVFYYVSEKEVVIIAVIHGARNYKSLL